jgi:epoxyqueuosine reductase
LSFDKYYIIQNYLLSDYLKEELRKLDDYLFKLNFKFKIISAEHIPEIRQGIKQLYIDKKISKTIFNYVSKYFQFNIPKNVLNERYIIIVAIPQKTSVVNFKIRGRKFDVIIPPTYIYKENQDRIYKILLKIFKDSKKINYAYLPKKIIAVRSGLAKYGRNNICYVEEMGSFNRLESYYIDFPLDIDNWDEESMMEECNICSLCRNACPNNCIREDEFVIKAEHCLTYFNENLNDFPDWVDIKSHNALVGCMICQNVCPINKKYKKNKVEILSFSEKESGIIIRGLEKTSLPLKLKEKLRMINMDEYLSVISRNIKVLI